MYIERLIDKDLLEWSTATSRKPLLIRGTRQVGKSTAVRHLAEKFEFFIEINFDEQPQYASLFKENISIDETIEQLSLITNTNIIEGKTLLFLDEIQACLPAISALRYFNERKPNLHVIAAGSLLEFALSELPSFGVGRMFVYPLSFTEFLGALNEKALANAILQSSANEPLNEIVHNKIKIYLKKFLIIGGMPEVVQTFISNRNLLEVQRLLDDLIISIQDDFTKYKKRIPSERVKLVFDSIVQQVGMKYRYSDQHSSLTSVQIKQVIDLLEMAGLVHPVTHSSCNGVPLGAESNIKKRKYLVFDTGIFQRMLGLDVASVLMKDDFEVVNKGNIAELFVGLELLKLKSCFEKTPLYYWHRESKNSQAEVDYVVQLQNKIVPIEVKAGTKGTMQSMFLFMDEKHSELGVRLSLENFSQYEKVRVYPLYAVSNVLESANE
jgi:predicted AAA+ superfamily ATPase